MRFLIPILLFFVNTLVSAQSQAITTAGDNNISNEGKIINWTIGGVVAGTSQTSNRYVNAGNIQTEYIIYNDSTNNNTIKIKCFPNPATDNITIELKLDTEEYEGYYWVLYSFNGDIIKRKIISNNTFGIDIRTLTASCYFINIYNHSNQCTASAKLVKK